MPTTKAQRKALIEAHAADCETCKGLGYVTYDAAFDPYAVECPTCRPYSTVVAPLEKRA